MDAEMKAGTAGGLVAVILAVAAGVAALAVAAGVILVAVARRAIGKPGIKHVEQT